MRLDRDQLQLHLVWGLPAVILTLFSLAWHFIASASQEDWLGGGSLVGLVIGTVAAVIILFEMFLWPRKLLRRFRLIAAKHWMAAHIWFGLACFPLASIHSGYHWGGPLTITLMILLALVTFSGIYGLWMQNTIPAWMLRNLPAETIYSQIDYVSQQTVADLRRLLSVACGPAPNISQDGESTRSSAPATPLGTDLEGEAVVVGAVRELGRTRGRTIRTATISTNREDAEVLWNAFLEIEPFLLQGQKAGGPVQDRMRVLAWFDLLRHSCHDSSNDIIMALQSACDQRHQFDIQRKVHWWLHGWLPIHLGLSIGLSILLVAHIVAALRYW